MYVLAFFATVIAAVVILLRAYEESRTKGELSAAHTFLVVLACGVIVIAVLVVGAIAFIVFQISTHTGGL